MKNSVVTKKRSNNATWSRRQLQQRERSARLMWVSGGHRWHTDYYVGRP